MKAWTVTPEQVEMAAREVGLRLRGISRAGKTDRSPLSFTLGLDTAQRREDGSLPYQRVSLSGNGRRVAAVCWHGHRDFMVALFDECPAMRLKSALADYRGEQDFEDKFEDTRGTGNGWNVGLSYGEACTCHEA